MEASTPTPEEVAKTLYPDVSVVEHETPLHGALKDFDYDAFGPELEPDVKMIIEATLDWLSSPLIQDEAADNTVRMYREDSFPEEVAELLKSNKAHPERVYTIMGVLGMLIDIDKTTGTNRLDHEQLKALTEIVEEYNLFEKIRNQLDDTEAQVWTTILPILKGNDMHELRENPHPFINGKFEELVGKMSAIAFDILQKLEKKG